MKRILIILLILVIASLGGCTNRNPAYKVYKQDGKWYLEIDYAKIDDLSSLYLNAAYQQFPSSVPEMVKTIKKGHISNEQLMRFSNYPEDNTVEIFDLDNAPDLATPSDLTCTYIRWENGFTYRFMFEGTQPSGYIWFLEQDNYNFLYNEEFYGLYNFYSFTTITSDRQISDRNAREVRYTNRSGEKFKYLEYDLAGKNLNLHIKEQYELPSNYLTEPGPRLKYIIICGHNGETYLYGCFSGFDERPSVEWLSAFGLK